MSSDTVCVLHMWACDFIFISLMHIVLIRLMCVLAITSQAMYRCNIPYCDYLIRVLFNANFAKTRKIALLNTRNNNAFTT